MIFNSYRFLLGLYLSSCMSFYTFWTLLKNLKFLFFCSIIFYSYCRLFEILFSLNWEVSVVILHSDCRFIDSFSFASIKFESVLNSDLWCYNIFIWGYLFVYQQHLGLSSLLQMTSLNIQAQELMLESSFPLLYLVSSEL